MALKNHFKNEADTVFGILDRITKHTATMRELWELPDIVEAWRNGLANLKSTNPETRPDYVVDGFWPKKKTSYNIYTLQPRCLPVGIKTCHYFEFKRVPNARREQIWGRKGSALEHSATAMKLHCKMFPGCKADGEYSVVPEICPGVEACVFVTFTVHFSFVIISRMSQQKITIRTIFVTFTVT